MDSTPRLVERRYVESRVNLFEVDGTEHLFDAGAGGEVGCDLPARPVPHPAPTRAVVVSVRHPREVIPTQDPKSSVHKSMRDVFDRMCHSAWPAVHNPLASVARGLTPGSRVGTRRHSSPRGHVEPVVPSVTARPYTPGDTRERSPREPFQSLPGHLGASSSWLLLLLWSREGLGKRGQGDSPSQLSPPPYPPRLGTLDPYPWRKTRPVSALSW